MAEKTITADPSVRKFLFAAFPAEAFAFAAVLLAADAKTGIVTAVLLFVTALIGAALYGRKSAGANVLRVALAVIYMAAFCGVQFGLNGYSYQGHFTAIACALLACLSFLGNAPEPVTDAEAGAAEGGAEGASADGTSGAAFRPQTEAVCSARPPAHRCWQRSCSRLAASFASCSVPERSSA